MFSILALDLDDTLVRSDRTISPHTLELLSAWLHAGNRIVIATGRPPRSTREIPRQLHDHHWICYNGSMTLHQDVVLSEALISVEDTQSVLQLLAEADPQCPVGLEIQDRLFVNSPQSRPDAECVEDLMTHAESPSAKIVLPLEQYQCMTDYHDRMPSSVRVLLSHKYGVAQIMPRGVSKAVALRQLVVDEWGMSMADVVAFGDDTNDLEMLQEAGWGVAMANAVPLLQTVADHVTKSNDDDGVAAVIEQLLPVPA